MIASQTEKTPELARKLARGKQLQQFATSWFRNLPDFVLEEGKLDGAYVGLSGVRGSIDYRIGESIFELKTKEELPKDIHDIWNLYPNDLEQLAFYSVLHPSYPKINYLIFMKNIAPFELKAFKIETNDITKIKNIILYRIKILREALEKKDPSNLGRCRYFGGCRFSEKKICNCEALKPISNDFLSKAIEIYEDDELTKKLEESKNASSRKTFLSVKDIIAPRKNYIEEIIGERKSWIPDKLTEGYKACLQILIKKLNFFVTPSEREKLQELLKIERFKIHHQWLKIKDSKNPDGEIIPFTMKVNNTKNKIYADKPLDYYIAELSIVGSLYGKSRGLTFVVYPNLKDLIQVFEINFDSQKILKRVKEVIKDLELAKEEKDIFKIHPCPSFMNDSQKCVLFKQCNKSREECA